MALPVKAKIWQYNLNVVTANTGAAATFNQRVVFYIKQALVAFASFPWVVEYSCNSVTAGTAGDGVDRWVTEANVIRSVSTGATGVRSWIVLKQAGIASNFQMLISVAPQGAAAGSTNAFVCSIYVSASAGFTGGTTTARPTATDETIVFEANNMGGSNVSLVAPTILNAMQSTDGQLTRIVMFSQNVPWMVLALDKPANTPASGWAVPFVAVPLVNDTAGVLFPVNYTNQAYWSTPATAVVRTRIGVAPATRRLVLTAEGTTSVQGVSDTNYGHVANELTGEWPFWPLGVACIEAPSRGRHATMVDMWAGSAAVPTGDTYDASSKDFIQVGPLILPWDGATTPVMA